MLGEKYNSPIIYISLSYFIIFIEPIFKKQNTRPDLMPVSGFNFDTKVP